LSGFTDLQDFQTACGQWVEQGLENGLAIRDDRWSEAIAVGSRPFVEKVNRREGSSLLLTVVTPPHVNGRRDLAAQYPGAIYRG